MLLVLARRNREALGEIGGRDLRLALGAARCEQVREQRLQQTEALGCNRTRRPLAGRVDDGGLYLGRRSGRGAFVRRPSRACALDDEPAELRRLEGNCTAVLAEDPPGEERGRR